MTDGKRSRPGGAWAALREELLYSPVTWLAILFVAAPLLTTYGLPGAKVAVFLQRRWFGIIGLVVIWRPFLAPAVAFLLYTFLFIGRRPETAERLRRRLLTRIRAGQDVGAEMTRIGRIAEEGNVDPEHLEASLSLWAGARYRREPALETAARRQVMELLTIDAREWQSQWLLPLYRAWLIRAEAMLRTDPRSAGCVPPPLGVGPIR